LLSAGKLSSESPKLWQHRAFNPPIEKRLSKWRNRKHPPPTVLPNSRKAESAMTVRNNQWDQAFKDGAAAAVESVFNEKQDKQSQK